MDCVWGKWQEGACTPDGGLGKRTDTRVRTTEEANAGVCDGEKTKAVCPLTKSDAADERNSVGLGGSRNHHTNKHMGRER